MGEFIAMELLRLKRVSVEEIDEMKAVYARIDVEGKGCVDRKVLRRSHLLYPKFVKNSSPRKKKASL